MATTDVSNFLVSETHLLLDEARKKKSERTKDIGNPIRLQSKALALVVKGGIAWIAESTAVARKLDLETGKTLHVFKGHTAPVTALAFCDKIPGSGDQKILITGSWDKTIKLWDTERKILVSSTDAHDDFVKALCVLPSIGLLVSASSDKIIRFWDISEASQTKPLTSLGSISAHTRPVECIQGKTNSDGSVILYTGDTMGIIKVWELFKESGPNPRWKASLKQELSNHRTRINGMVCGNGQLWTASADDTVQVSIDPDVQAETKIKLPQPILHPKQVRCILPIGLTDVGEPYLITGSEDIIRVYDISTFDEPELIREVDAHWHDVLALQLWIRKSLGSDGLTRVEPWVISTSLDGTIRKWRLIELVSPPQSVEPEPEVRITPIQEQEPEGFGMTEDEERELAELMED
ncbi:WD40 repeat-like protein [Macrolepiota fuliginosa MF-IS2]|uniref:WD40 repeat-like protein n=1 Tax=Macrolepiota fuliginosa MF-IS2 TaxID=1400762 RepID=A0A9P5XK48_9AGAR|nr:WD40 repeat-like protein [Macrolepiota fuliginosa MF-IS2]